MCAAGLVLQPLPVGAWAFAGLTVTVATKTLPFATAFAAFRNEVIWLIVVSFYFARGFEKCGLGDRIANLFVKLMGKSTLGLAYGLVIAEGIIAPAMPSTSARAGGIFMPIIKSLSEAAGSYPGETSKKLGSFLVFTILHVRTPQHAQRAAGSLPCSHTPCRLQREPFLTTAPGGDVRRSSDVCWVPYAVVSCPRLTRTRLLGCRRPHREPRVMTAAGRGAGCNRDACCFCPCAHRV